MVPERTTIPPLPRALEALTHAGRVAAPDDIRRARACIRDLTCRLEERHAQSLQAELNDAYLRVQFAVVTGHSKRLRAEAGALARLVREARDPGAA